MAQKEKPMCWSNECVSARRCACDLAWPYWSTADLAVPNLLFDETRQKPKSLFCTKLTFFMSLNPVLSAALTLNELIMFNYVA